MINTRESSPPLVGCRHDVRALADTTPPGSSCLQRQAQFALKASRCCSGDLDGNYGFAVSQIGQVIYNIICSAFHRGYLVCEKSICCPAAADVSPTPWRGILQAK
jgi:hypothetical protein